MMVKKYPRQQGSSSYESKERNITYYWYTGMVLACCMLCHVASTPDYTAWCREYHTVSVAHRKLDTDRVPDVSTEICTILTQSGGSSWVPVKGPIMRLQTLANTCQHYTPIRHRDHIYHVIPNFPTSLRNMILRVVEYDEQCGSWI